MVFATEQHFLMWSEKDEYPKKDNKCDALFVFPDPDCPVKTIDCGLSIAILWIILLAERK